MKTAVQETSINTYHNEVEHTLGDRQECVYRELLNAENLTNSELASRLDWPINTVTPRVFELRKMGLVVEDTRRPCRVTQRTAIAWCVIRKTLF